MEQALRYANIMSRLLDAPLWAHPVKAAVIYNALCGRFGSAPIAVPDAPGMSRFIGEWPAADAEGDGNSTRARVEPFRLTPQGVGVVTVTGTLVTRGAWIGSHSGMTSYEGIKHQLGRAAADKRVKSIILDLDTPGGEANGAFEAAAAVRAAAERKPVIAVANGMAASAGYALAAGATKVITAPSGVTGSIGCVLLHLDYSRALDDEGITPTLIVAGAHKMDGNALQPLNDETTATLRAEVARYYDLFIDTVAAGRGRTTPATVARGTEGRTYIGREAVDARLADDVGTFEDVLHDLTRRAGHATSVSSAQAKGRDGMDPLFEDERPPVQTETPAVRIVESTAQGEANQIARFKAIAGDSRCQGKMAFAVKLAVEAPQMTADAVAALCADLPMSSSDRLSLAARDAETGAAGISSAPVPDERGTSRTWDAAIAKTNARTLTEVAKRR